MRKFKQFLTAAAALSLLSSTEPARADPIKDIVLVHGAWVDASGWKPVYEILTKEGFKVTMLQEPETSLQDDVTATKRILDLQDGPTLLVGHSYGGSIITEAGVLRVLYTLGGYRPCRMNPAPLAQFRIERSPGGLGVVGASRSLLRLEPV